MRRLILTTLLALLVPATVALAEASHAGWPQINGVRLMDKGPPGESHVLRGDPSKHNELLGGYGNDTLYGGQAGDVLWADYQPSGQPANQVTTIYAGNGKNFIYASHGTNYIFTGTGPSSVLAHYGRGVIHCQSARVSVTVSHISRAHYKLPGCKHIHID
ncbi:MAG TPA: hypothetical protein VHX88_22280 [Solirubrobacteraceae bacterium]|jgi:hypothetical protein|nr:hypothetical protein [Solirubrobacteraceae bacterium]